MASTLSAFDLVRLTFSEVDASPGFAAWLIDQRVSLAITNANSLVLVGTKQDGTLSVVVRPFALAGALLPSGKDSLYLSTRYQIWRLENGLPADAVTDDGHDRLFLPQTAWTTGLVGVQGMGLDPLGRVVFANGRFSCLSVVSDRLNFEVVWRPPFISAIVPESRCLLSGLAMADGQPAYVTAASTTDTQDGWRDRRRDGGVVMSVPSGEVVTAGLSMPHSPVVEGDRLWIANSGAGELGVVDAGGAFEPVAQLPGLTRGLALHGHFAVVGASKPRRGESLAGLPLEDRMPASGGGSRCGVFVVDLDTGRLEHSILFDGGPPEVQDVAVLRDCRSPDAVEFNGDLVQEWVTVPTDLATVQENQRKGGAST